MSNVTDYNYFIAANIIFTSTFFYLLSRSLIFFTFLKNKKYLANIVLSLCYILGLLSYFLYLVLAFNENLIDEDLNVLIFSNLCLYSSIYASKKLHTIEKIKSMSITIDKTWTSSIE